MNQYPISVTSSGAVLLGPDISCDGFHKDYRTRIQTHIHIDHMDGFETSKGFQNIYASEPTRQLLIAEKNADIAYRQNIKAVKEDEIIIEGQSQVRLISNDHMLGSVQVEVQLVDGRRIGYSGDFQWPMDQVLSVDGLVLDSTSGSANSIREFTQSDAEECLLQEVKKRIKNGPVFIKAHRGTLHRGMQILSEIEYPLIGSPRLCEELRVYRDNGYGIREMHSTKSEITAEIIKEGRYVRFYGTGDRRPVNIDGTLISLSAFRTARDNPVIEYSERALRICLSNHADFNGTLEYVQATGAEFVLTDNSRGGHAYELAFEIAKRLGIAVLPSTYSRSREWGS